VRRLALALALVTLASVAHAQSTAPSSSAPVARRRIYQVPWAVDLPVIGVSAAGWALGQFWLPTLITPSCPCSSDHVLPIDRVALHRNDSGIALTSDIALFSLIALPLALDALDVGLSHGTATEYLEDATVIAETIVVSGALDQIAKVAFVRPRPLLYDLAAGSPELRVGDNYLSFYSSHTSTAFAATLAYAWTLWRRHPRSAAAPIAFTLAGLLGTGEGVLRVAAGKHFPTDVITGALAGTLVGLGIPWLHSRRIPLRLAVIATADGGSAVLGGWF
jgi:membrane-associated phospholipid phosphatase